jgi:multidrug efflux pump
MTPEDLNKWFVRNNSGQMVPFSSFSAGEWIYASPRLERYNGLPSTEILGAPAPGQSSGTAMAEIEKLAAQLPPGIGFEWTGLSTEERDSGSQTTQLYAISVLIVFLCLAALYESWSIPFSVLLVVPLGVIGAVVATYVFKLSNDVYFQVGLLTVVGLAAKNAILIVEFAKELQDAGEDLKKATLHAVKMRLRPILMTSIAFGLGVFPLAISSGAGSGSQNAIGIGVLGGMLTATFLGIFFVPLFFVLVRGYFAPKKPAAPAPAVEVH